MYAEHRYFGESMPFGNESYKNASNLRYLTSEQALEDYKNLLIYYQDRIIYCP